MATAITQDEINTVFPTVADMVADALGCDVADVKPDASLIEDLGADVTIAGIIAPDNCLISGPKADTVAVVAAAAKQGGMAQVFTVGDIPGHGPLMTPYANKLTASIDFLEPRRNRIPIISTVTGGLIDGTELDPEYWGRNLRQTVRFTDAMASAVDAGGELFIEIAAHPVVEVAARRCLDALGATGTVHHTIKQGEPGPLALRRVVERLEAHAGDVRIDALARASGLARRLGFRRALDRPAGGRGAALHPAAGTAGRSRGL